MVAEEPARAQGRVLAAARGPVREVEGLGPAQEVEQEPARGPAQAQALVLARAGVLPARSRDRGQAKFPAGAQEREPRLALRLYYSGAAAHQETTIGLPT